MDSLDLTKEQIEKIRKAFGRYSCGLYLTALVERFDAVGFSRTDPVYTAAIRARDACGSLSMALYYAGCDRVGHARRAD
jgi:hypothetical protein